MNPPRVVITIESLSFTGLGVRDGHRVGQVLQQELTRLVQDRGVPAGLVAGREISTLKLPSLSPTMRRAPDPLGQALANALYDSLDRPLEVAP